MNKLLAKLKRDINYQGCSTSLRTIVENLGFKRQKPENNRWVLIENTDVRLKRILYLKAIKKYRDKGRPIVFVDESYVRSSHTKSKAWSDGSAQGLKRPISNGQGIVMVHSGSETGFVPNTLLMYKSGTKTGDFNGMNFEIYEKWVRTQLIPNLSPDSVVVIDNAPYHNILMDPAPTSNDKKAKMQSWLEDRGIPYEKEMCKPQLYDLIKKNKDERKKYIVDEMLKKHNHEVLRLPPYHPDLNPVEMAWDTIKGYVASKNVDGNVTRTMELIQEKVNLMGPKECKVLYTKVKEVEDEYRKSDHIIDELTEQIIINSASDSESESEIESDNYSDDEPMPSDSD